MKRIGLIGGLSPESTVQYYKTLCEDYNRQAGGLNFPPIVLDSINLEQLVELFGKNEWQEVGSILLGSLARLKGAGADFAAILANTPHNAYDLIRDQSPLEIVTIMDATGAALDRDGIRKVGLLGTWATMEFGFFQKHFAARGIETYVPGPEFRAQLDRIIWKELAHGQVSSASQQAAQEMVASVEAQGVEALILGCTELALLIDSSMTSLLLYDTLTLHARFILEFAQGSLAGAARSGRHSTTLASPPCSLEEHPDW